MPKTAPKILTTRIAMSNRVGTVSSTVVSTNSEAGVRFMIFGPTPEFKVVTQQVWVSESRPPEIHVKPTHLSGYRSLANLAGFSTESYLLQKQEDRERENRRCQGE